MVSSHRYAELMGGGRSTSSALTPPAALVCCLACHCLPPARGPARLRALHLLPHRGQDRCHRAGMPLARTALLPAHCSLLYLNAARNGESYAGLPSAQRLRWTALYPRTRASFFCALKKIAQQTAGSADQLCVAAYGGLRRSLGYKQSAA